MEFVPTLSVSLVPALLLKVNVKTMKKMPLNESPDSDEELLAEYHFDYQKAKLNRFAAHGKPKMTVVVLDEDVAQVFTTPESVNKALRALIEAIPQVAKGDSAS